jgi:CrcB protein
MADAAQRTGRADMTAYAWIVLGSALGGIVRFWLSGLVARRVGETFPWGTMAVNVSGAFAIGIFAGATGLGAATAPAATHFVVIGLLGSYTTVSSFSLNTLALARDGEWLRAAGNIVLSVTLCLLAVVLGDVSGRIMAAA